MPDAGSWSVPGYTLVRPLGGGETGNVVLATHDASGRSVAIKYLSARLLGRAEFVERFRGEARALAGLTDPNVARLLEYVEAPPAGAAIVMEPVDGITLRRVLDTRGSMPPEAALVLLRGSLSGLAAAHAAGVVHRDYKPGNVLVRRDGSTALVDFGIAVRAGEGAVAEGTPAYMPPEQWAGAPLGPAADVYAATAVFYECLTGRPPYSPEGSAGSVDLAGLARAHQSAPIPLDDVPEPVRALVARGLAKDPAARPPGAAAFVAELDRVATDHAGPFRAGRRWPERSAPWRRSCPAQPVWAVWAAPRPPGRPPVRWAPGRTAWTGWARRSTRVLARQIWPGAATALGATGSGRRPGSSRRPVRTAISRGPGTAASATRLNEGPRRTVSVRRPGARGGGDPGQRW